MHKVIFENQSSAIRGLESHIMICTNTLKQTKQTKKQGKQVTSEQASKKKTFLATSV